MIDSLQDFHNISMTLYRQHLKVWTRQASVYIKNESVKLDFKITNKKIGSRQMCEEQVLEKGLPRIIAWIFLPYTVKRFGANQVESIWL